IIDPDNSVIDIGAFEVQDGGSGPRWAVLSGGKPIHPDVVALVDTRFLQQSGTGMRSATNPDVGLIDTLFDNNSAMQPGVVVGRPTVMDVITTSHMLKGNRQDLTQADAFDLVGAFVAD